MEDESRSLKGQPTGGSVQALIIVARDRLDLWHDLTQHFAANEDVGILLDRRQEERRQWVRSYAPDRRGPDRRSLPRIEHDLRFRQFVIVRRKRGRFEG